MKIVIANQKGGVGKSTTCVLLANYLALEKNESVVIFDMDQQETVYSKWERDRELYENEPLYEVLKLDLEDYPKYAADLEALKGETQVIIDMPGRLDDDTILSVIKDADLIICPIAYERSVFESSHVFARVARHLNADNKIVFLPTRLNKAIKYETKEKVREAMAAFGEIAPEIAERVALQRIDTVSISSEAREVVQESFDFIYNRYIS
ncbi:chromosome partitioning protein [Pontibacter ummariensis]|uniref:Chromosome partitioning protein n=1 Tax=Pontibacter ummariensis TaxID=1610492 RepID=A0A239DUP3_9BACT|nr:ParA family protein [Pontibacter ummariensis]PRY13747.1 chromosome partitioning protein [Pontibacter ummariensis]SNS36166.1 chromosome partitioning protein [Pontibacter ummariensis]